MTVFDESGVARDAGGARCYTHRPDSLVHMLRTSVERWPDQEAIVDLGQGERISYRVLWQRAARVAGGLAAAGVTRGDRAAILFGNGLDWVLAFFGCQLAGVIAVPVNTRFSPAEIDYVIDNAGARFVFRPGEPLPDGNPLAVEDLRPTDSAAIFYTSGTTGFPKGAVTTHRNFLSNSESARRVLKLPADGTLRNLVSVPLFHVTGCHSQLVVSLELGGATVIMPAFEVQAFLHAIEAERISVMVSVPAIYWLAINQDNFADFDTSSVQRITYGGAPIAPELVGRIKQAFPSARVGNAFGLTETASLTTALPHEYADSHAASVGFPTPVMEVKLKDPDPASGVGELLIRGSNVVDGYWQNPEATAKTFAGGWLHSGDLARIDDEGLVYIVDRAKDMINRGGENVYCVEVENCLAAHPEIFEAAVLGVPDSMMGEKVGAVIVPKPGRAIDPEDVVAFCRTRIGDFKVPQYVHVTTEPLPRNPGGKVLKARLREAVTWDKALF